jgi:hypothetical protein
LVKDEQNTDDKQVVSKSSSRRDVALLIIIPAFLVFGAIIGLQVGLMFIGNGIVSEKTISESKIEFWNTISDSVNTLTNILIPVLAAWVGGVVAYYFGSKQAENASIQQANVIEAVRGDKTDFLSSKTVEDLIDDEDPSLKNFMSVTINDKINPDFQKKIEDQGHVVVFFDVPKWKNAKLSEENLSMSFSKYVNLPLGVLYEGDVYALDNYDDYYNDNSDKALTLGEMIEGKKNVSTEDQGTSNEILRKRRTIRLIDTITNKPWSANPETRMDNFAEIYLSDTLRDAKAKLVDVGSNPDNAKGLVLDDDGKVVAVISNHDILSLV